MNALAPAVLASQILDQNRKLVRRKKRSKAIGFPTPLRQRLAMRNTTEMDEMDLDANDPVTLAHDSSESMMMGEDLDEVYHQSRLHRSGRIARHVEHSKSFQISVISWVNQNIYIDHEGPSGLTHDDSLSPDPPHEDDFMDHDHQALSPLPNDNAGTGENINGEVYGLSKLRRSRRIADSVDKIGQQRWGSKTSIQFLNSREESDEEEEDTEDEEPTNDPDAASDEGLEGYEDDDDELFAGPGLEGISLWDSLGEGFLNEASQLGTLFKSSRYYLNSNSCSRGKDSG